MVDLPTIQRISGHKTLTMVLRYTHVHGSHIDRAVKAIGRGLPDLSKARNPDTITPELHIPAAAQAGSAAAVSGKALQFNELGMEARAGIEPTYEDLQSSA